MCFNERNLLVFLSGKLWGRKWTLMFVSGESTTIKREEVGAPPWGPATPWVMPPFSYKRRWRLPLLFNLSLILTCPLVGIFLPLLACPPHEHLLRRSPAQSFLHHHHHHVVVLLDFPRIHCFPCPTRARDGGRRWAVRVTEYGSATFCNTLLSDLEIGKWSSTSPTRIVLVNAC